MKTIRVGLIGLGANSRLRHVPGLRACPGVELVGVSNRRAASTAAAAQEFGIPKTYAQWQTLIADPEIDAVVIGTWPSTHCEITLAALAAGKHVLTEARMARNADEARRMLDASRRHPDLVTQIVPSPFGLGVDRYVKQLLSGGFLGRLQEVVALGITSAFADATAPLHWRQTSRDSGQNMLALGILHETLLRWVPEPERIYAQSGTFTTQRLDPETGSPGVVDIPDAVHVLSALRGGARCLYHLSNVAHFGPGMQIHLYGSEGTLKYQFTGEDQLSGGQRGDAQLRPLPVPADLQGRWRVEEEFIEAIRGREPVRYTDFATGVRYMEFTSAVARSLESGQAVTFAP